METPCPKRISHLEMDLWEDEYKPRARRDLTPIFELVIEPITPPNTPEKKTIGQKSYYGKKRLIKADI